jgi:ElaB/YqjD/DUF883 family membrane-anchored ribosome-binding protein
MDQQRNEDVMSDATAKVSDLSANAEKMVQDKIDQSKPVLRNLQEAAGAAMDKATDVARKASTPVIQAADAIHGIAQDVGQAANTVYQQGARAGGSVSRYTSEQPLTALVIAGAIGYGIAYLIHRA